MSPRFLASRASSRTAWIAAAAGIAVLVGLGRLSLAVSASARITGLALAAIVAGVALDAALHRRARAAPARSALTVDLGRRRPADPR